MISDLYSQQTYLVEKFFPPRCPKCEHRFYRNGEDFGTFFGEHNPATSFSAAQAYWMERWPEIWQQEVNLDLPETARNILAGKRAFSGNQFEFDFIICTHCNNVTLRIMYAQRHAVSIQEAERLLETEGFVSISEVQATGNMVKSYSKLSWLAKSDLQMLETAVKLGRENSSKVNDGRIAGDIFAVSVDRALTEMIKKNAQAEESNRVRVDLQGYFGKLWGSLEPDARDILITAEIINHDLSILAESTDSVDFSAVVSGYSKALERTLLYKIFTKFKESSFSVRLPGLTGKKSLDGSIDTLQRFVLGQQEITLGSMAFCLLNVGGKLRHAEENGFAQFLRTEIGDIDRFIDIDEFPARLIDYVDNYRNKSAHVSKITQQECIDARAFLLEEPVKLLILIEERLTNNPGG